MPVAVVVDAPDSSSSILAARGQRGGGPARRKKTKQKNETRGRQWVGGACLEIRRKRHQFSVLLYNVLSAPFVEPPWAEEVKLNAPVEETYLCL